MTGKNGYQLKPRCFDKENGSHRGFYIVKQMAITQCNTLQYKCCHFTLEEEVLAHASCNIQLSTQKKN